MYSRSQRSQDEEDVFLCLRSSWTLMGKMEGSFHILRREMHSLDSNVRRDWWQLDRQTPLFFSVLFVTSISVPACLARKIKR